MQSFFTAEFFIGNRRRIRQELATDAPIVMSANGLLQRGADSTYSFSQDANFWYLTGIDEPDVILVIEKDCEYLIVPTREATRTAFDGALDLQAFSDRSGIQTVYETDEGWKHLTTALHDLQAVATIVPATDYIENYGMYVNPARARLLQKMQAAVPGLEVIDFARQLIHLRMIKQRPELAAMQQAIDITLATIKQAITATKLNKYKFEYELEAEISRGFRARGASGHSFESIVAGGVRACTLHNVANNSAFAANELIVIDVGAEVEHYAADITRTVCNGAPSDRARQVHQAVADVQQYGFSILKPGMKLAEFEKMIEEYMGQKLVALGLIQEAEHDSIRKYYPHATSHFLGLNVHDAGDYDLPLAAGMVVTVEPGIYIPEESIGVRIEDDVLIMPNGIKILSKALSGSLK